MKFGNILERKMLNPSTMQGSQFYIFQGGTCTPFLIFSGGIPLPPYTHTHTHAQFSPSSEMPIFHKT